MVYQNVVGPSINNWATQHWNSCSNGCIFRLPFACFTLSQTVHFKLRVSLKYFNSIERTEPTFYIDVRIKVHLPVPPPNFCKPSKTSKTNFHLPILISLMFFNLSANLYSTFVLGVFVSRLPVVIELAENNSVHIAANSITVRTWSETNLRERWAVCSTNAIPVLLPLGIVMEPVGGGRVTRNAQTMFIKLKKLVAL